MKLSTYNFRGNSLSQPYQCTVCASFSLIFNIPTVCLCCMCVNRLLQQLMMIGVLTQVMLLFKNEWVL